MSKIRYNSNNWIVPNDRVIFKSCGYKDRTFHARVLEVYRFGESDTRKWRALIDDGLGLTPRVVKYERLQLYER